MLNTAASPLTDIQDRSARGGRMAHWRKLMMAQSQRTVSGVNRAALHGTQRSVRVKDLAHAAGVLGQNFTSLVHRAAPFATPRLMSPHRFGRIVLTELYHVLIVTRQPVPARTVG